MAGKLTISTVGLAKWVALEVKEFKKDAATVLNNAAGDVCLRAVNLVKRADAKQMDKLLKAKPDLHRILKSGRRSKSPRGSTKFPSKYVFAVLSYYQANGRMPSWAYGVLPKKLVGNIGPIGGGRRTAAAVAYVNAKKSSIGYIAVGFIMAAKFFGKPVTTKISDKGWIHHSTGEKATANNLTAKIMNFARGADKAPGVAKALQAALDSVASGMAAHITKKMMARAAAAKVSP